MEEKTLPRGKFRWQNVVPILLALFAIYYWGIFTPPFSRAKPNHFRSSCQSNLKQIMLGVKQYIQDYDEKYPILATSKAEFGWAGALQPYLKSTQIFQCPSELTPPQELPAQTGYTDYWFNARMAGVPERQLDNQALTISLGDGDSGNARYQLSAIPKNWRKNEKSPLYRHLDGANYAFADGHAKWFKNDAWKDSLDTRDGNTFRLKPRN